ncbi:MAG: Hpt domain-containing protein [Angelakisella sp.]|jgi:HPt (histidine-containing phosphotransfer) domain-containing protein|nr:Hpt domain-containing protein [Angelakisella sp.]MCI9667022.1 Hpt domain-containing protein [Angelakisella sp.]
MTLKECYEKMEANYDEVIGRLRSERLVQKFALKFLDDPSYQLLITSMEEKNYEEAFRAAHTIKGVCQNLGFTRLGDSSSALTESLRSGWTPEADRLLEQTKADYQNTVTPLQSLKDSQQ